MSSRAERTDPALEAELPDFLRLLGKREVLPGGRYARELAFERLALHEGERALVLGDDAARTAALLRESCGADVESAALDAIPEDRRYGAVLLEQALTGQPHERRPEVLRALRSVLRQGGRLALVEMAWRQRPTEERKQALAHIWRAEMHPLALRGWWDLLEAAGFRIEAHDLAVVSLFTPQGMQRDEAEHEAALFHAAFASPERLARFAEAYEEFSHWRRYHGVLIALCR